MRTVPDLIFAIENLILKGQGLDKNVFDEDDIENYDKVKSLVQTAKPGTYDARNLKLNSSLKEKLFRQIFNFIPSKSKYSILQRNVVEIIKKQAIASLFKGLGYSKLSNTIYESVFSKSKKYNYSLGILESSRSLFYRTANDGNLNKAKKYYEECLLALKVTENEIVAEWCSSELRNHFTKTKEITKALETKAQNHFNQLNEVDKDYRSRKFLRDFITVGIIHFESKFQFTELCQFLKNNIQYAEENFSDDISLLKMLRLYNSNYLLRIKDLAAFEKNFAVLFPMIISKSNQWFRIHELKMLYGLRKGDYNLSIKIYNVLKGQTRYKSLNSDMRNRIELNWLYAVISKALLAGKREAKDVLREVKLGKYLNSIPDFYKDKKGMNIAIIIVQLLYYIILKDLNQLDERFEAVEKYLSRYMKSDPLYRSQCFIKMLLQVPKQNFHPVAIERHADRYYWNLKSMPFLESHHPNEIELTEYEVLWEQVMNFLKER